MHQKKQVTANADGVKVSYDGVEDLNAMVMWFVPSLIMIIARTDVFSGPRIKRKVWMSMIDPGRVLSCIIACIDTLHI